MTRPRFIIFDLDGTLIDSSEGVVAAVNYSLRQMGEPEQPPERIKPFIGFPLSKMYPYFSDLSVKELYSHFQIKAKETVVSSTVKLPGVDTVLQQLNEQGITTAIASTKIRPHITGIIDKFSWHDYFKVYSGGNEVAQVKPAPDIFKLTLERLRATADEALVVGDTINDILAAKRVPMKVAYVTSPYESLPVEEKAEPDYELKSLKELLKLVL